MFSEPRLLGHLLSALILPKLDIPPQTKPGSEAHPPRRSEGLPSGAPPDASSHKRAPRLASRREVRATQKAPKRERAELRGATGQRLTAGCCDASPARLVDPCLELNLFQDSANLPRLALLLLRLPSSSLSKEPFSASLGLLHFFPIFLVTGKVKQQVPSDSPERGRTDDQFARLRGGKGSPEALRRAPQPARARSFLSDTPRSRPPGLGSHNAPSCR